jgi:N-acetylmuramoyl-L-alanine amidase
MSLSSWLKSLFAKPPVVIQAPPVDQADLDHQGPELIHPDDRGILKLGIIVGHTAKAPGEKMYGLEMHEYDYNKEIASIAKTYAELDMPQVQVEVILRDVIGIAGAYQRAIDLKCDAVIELHFNGHQGEAAGTETLCTSDNTDVDFAQVIHNRVCKIFQRGGASRGVKVISRAIAGGENVHSFPAGVNCLVEPFFGDTPAEALLAQKLKHEYACGLIDAVALWGRQVDLLR